jgi:diguanylate cyclase (GGDEF)-like protein
LKHEEKKRFQKIEQLVPMIRIATVLFVTLIIIESIPLDFNAYYLWPVFCFPLLLYMGLMSLDKLYKRFKTINPLVPEHLEMFVFLGLALLLIYVTGGDESNYKIIYLFPVIFYSLKFGSRWGYVISSLNTAMILYLKLTNIQTDYIHLEVDLVLTGMFFLFSWLIGNMVDLERLIRKRLLRAVVRDELTGLYNYRYFRQQLKEMIKEHKQDSSTWKIGLILIDLDNFKLYNEVLGHLSGDILLQKVASTINNYLGKDDFAARYGGDEFAVVISTQETSHVIGKAEKIRKEINAYNNDILGSDWNLAASLGIALFPDHAEDLESLVQKADEALYKAKMTKGNRVQVYYSVFDRLSEKKLNIVNDFLTTVKTLLSVLQAKDIFTYGHSERVLVYAQVISRKLGLPSSELALIEYAAFLHDIGKIEIEREILNKPEPLTEKEQALLNQHPLWSAEIIKPFKKMEPVLPLIIHHHEKYDGKGYPYGLKGDDIPLGARIIAVADAFDQLTADRPFKKGNTIHEGIEFLKQNKWSRFDPLIVDIFSNCLSEYENISRIIEWPKDLTLLVPAGYLPGSFLKGYHYLDFYSGDIHFAIKATTYLAAGIANNEKCIYYTNEKKEEILVNELNQYSYRGTRLKTIIKENQLSVFNNLENVIKFIKRKAKTEFETKKIFKKLLDEANQEGYTSIRVLLDGSSLPLKNDNLITWENNLTRCIKDMDIVIIYLYNINENSIDMMNLLHSMHAKPLLDEENTDAKEK